MAGPTEGAFCLFKPYWKGKLNQKTSMWEFQMEVTVSFDDLRECINRDKNLEQIVTL